METIEDKINEVYHQRYPEIHKVAIERAQKIKTILKTIPHFWKTALFGNSNLDLYLENEDKETETALDSLINIDIDYPADSENTFVLTFVLFHTLYLYALISIQLSGI